MLTANSFLCPPTLITEQNFSSAIDESHRSTDCSNQTKHCQVEVSSVKRRTFFYAELWLKNALSMLGNYSISRYIIKTNFAFLAGSSSNLFLNAGELSWFNNFHNSLRSKTRRHKNVFSILRHSEIDRMWNAIFISISKWCKREEKKGLRKIYWNAQFKKLWFKS